MRAERRMLLVDVVGLLIWFLALLFLNVKPTAAATTPPDFGYYAIVPTAYQILDG